MKAYNANGLLPNSINCSTIFGHDPASTWYLDPDGTEVWLCSGFSDAFLWS